MNKTIYVAIPYTFNPEKSYEIANIVSAKLIERGYFIFSPVTLFHPISKVIDNSFDNHAFWMKHCLHHLDLCDELCVVDLGEHNIESAGCKMEIDFARNNDIPIMYYKLND